MQPLIRLFHISFALILAFALIGCSAKPAVKDSPKKAVKAKAAEKSPAKADQAKEKTDENAEANPPVAGLPFGIPQQSQPKSLEELLNPMLAKKSPGAGSPAIPPAASGKPSAVPPGKLPPGKLPPDVAAALAKGKRPTAKQLLDVIRLIYGNIESLQIAGTASTTVKYDGKIVRQSKGEKFKMSYKRPGKFVMIDKGAELVSDGKTIYNYIPTAKRYTKNKMDKDVLWEIVQGRLGLGTMGLLFGVDYSPAISSMSLLNDAKINGKDVYVLQIKLKQGVGSPKGMDAVQTLWIGKAEPVIYRNQVIGTVKPKKSADTKDKVPTTIQTITVGETTSFTGNVKLDDKLFTFKPPAGAKLLEEPKDVDVTGKHAPDFGFKWIDGERKKLSDFRGQTVLLVFWALPMAEQELPVLQSLFKDDRDGVQLIAINLNNKTEAVAKYMGEKGYTFPYIFGGEEIGEFAVTEYGVRVLPTLFIIDKSGIVREGMAGDPKEKDILPKLEKAQQ